MVSSCSEHDARCTTGKTEDATDGAALDDGAVGSTLLVLYDEAKFEASRALAADCCQGIDHLTGSERLLLLW